MPPLRERRQDIPLLVWAFVEEFSKTMGKTIRAIAKDSMEALESYSWPGNIRELRNVIERAMMHGRRPDPARAGAGQCRVDSARRMAMADVEREHILHALEVARWRVRGKDGAAALLQLKPTTLEARMAKLDIRRPGR